jgi:hypothetical protein
MIASVVVPVVVHWQSDDLCELKESKSDENSDDELKADKEEVYVINNLLSILAPALSSEKTKEKQYYKHECLVSENHSFLPEIPPEI